MKAKVVALIASGLFGAGIWGYSQQMGPHHMHMSPWMTQLFKIINSISPRAFMSVPTASAVRLLSPFKRAANQQAAPFPAIAANRTTIPINSSCGLFTVSSRVFPPIDGLNGHRSNFVIALSLGDYEHAI
jgi:hypothetical protein